MLEALNPFFQDAIGLSNEKEVRFREEVRKLQKLTAELEVTEVCF